jgi:hypothetical protein
MLRKIPVVPFGDRHKPAGARRDTQEPRAALARAGRHMSVRQNAGRHTVGTLGWHQQGCTVGPRPPVRPIFGTY